MTKFNRRQSQQSIDFDEKSTCNNCDASSALNNFNACFLDGTKSRERKKERNDNDDDQLSQEIFRISSRENTLRNLSD